MQRFRILHISDLHERGSHEKEHWRRSRVLGEAWEKNLWELKREGAYDAVCFTGDAANWGKEDEYESSSNFFRRLLEILGVSRERLFVVPGNHDIDRAIGQDVWNEMRRALSQNVDRLTLSRWMTGQNPPQGFQNQWRSAILERQRAYRNWTYSQLGRAELDPSASPHGILGYRSSIRVTGTTIPVHIIGLDSAWMCGDDQDNGQLWLTEDQCMRLATDTSGKSLPGLRILLMHHPFHHLADGSECQRLLANHVDLVLRGHLHETSLVTFVDPDQKMRELAAGCLYEGARTDTWPNSCQVITFQLDDHGRPGEIEVRFRGWSSKGFWFDDDSLYKDTRQGRVIWAGADVVGMVPRLPEPYFVHPYPLQKYFSGRISERNRISSWFMTGNSPAMFLVGLGGLGKSALAWVWTLSDLLGFGDVGFSSAASQVPVEARPEGVLWWSFYETGARFNAFVDAALEYFSAGKLEPTETKLAALIKLLKDRRFLIVLDGFERELHAYASLSAAYRDDSAIDHITRELRRPIDPQAADFLSQICTGPSVRSRILFTTRLCPVDTKDLEGATVFEMDGLSSSDAIAYFRAQRIEGTDVQIELACQQYGHHPLAIRLLAGLILHDKKYPRDIRAAKRNKMGEKLHGRHSNHILSVAYDAMEPLLRQLLSRIAAFRSPVEYGVLEKIAESLRLADLDAAIDELLERSLLFTDGGRYDLHPIVRQHAYDRLLNKKGIHTELINYFSTIPVSASTETPEELGPVVELYHHTIRAGLFTQALSLMRDRIFDPLHHRHGQYLSSIALLQELFSNDETEVVNVDSDQDRGWAFSALALSHSRTGLAHLAMKLQAKANDLTDLKTRGVGIGQLAYDQLSVGMIAEAQKNVTRWLDLACDSGDKFHEALAQKAGAILAAYRGSREADWRLQSAETLFLRERLRPLLADTLADRAFLLLLRNDANLALQSAREASDIATAIRHPREIIRADFLIGVCLTRLDKFQSARAYLTEALRKCEHIRLAELEPSIELAWAAWHAGQKQFEDAVSRSSRALALAERCSYRLIEAEVHLFLGELYLTTKNLEKALFHLGRSIERANCGDKGFRYEGVHLKASSLLKQVG